MGWSPSEVQLPVGVPERTGQHHVADMLSQTTTHLNSGGHVQSILDGVALGVTHRAEGCDPAVVEGDHGVEKEEHVSLHRVGVG